VGVRMVSGRKVRDVSALAVSLSVRYGRVDAAAFGMCSVVRAVAVAAAATRRGGAVGGLVLLLLPMDVMRHDVGWHGGCDGGGCGGGGGGGVVLMKEKDNLILLQN
jgi:hypothetical protein